LAVNFIIRHSLFSIHYPSPLIYAGQVFLFGSGPKGVPFMVNLSRLGFSGEVLVLLVLTPHP